MQFFFTQSGKNYTGQKKFTQAPLVMLVTNMRYGSDQTRNDLQEMVKGYSATIERRRRTKRSRRTKRTNCRSLPGSFTIVIRVPGSFTIN